MNQENHVLGRRQFAKLGAAALGLSAFGSSVVAAESTDRFIVKRNGDSTLDAEVLYDMPEIGYALVSGTEAGLEQSNAVKAFAPDLELSFVDPAASATHDGALSEVATDDGYYPFQWDKQDLDIPTAHETTTGANTRVAIIDSGIDTNHPDLDINASLSHDFTGDGLGSGVPGGGDHGTHVAGIVGASIAGNTGVAGTAPDTELVDLRVFSDFGGVNGSFGIVIAAMIYASNVGCDVANLSLGAYPIPRQALGSFYGAVMNKASTYVSNNGTLLVISAGNDASDLQDDSALISLPNEAAGALSVAATGPTGYADALFAGESLVTPPESPAFYTNYGTNAVDIGAPGGDADLTMTDPVGGIPAYAYDLVFNTVSTVVTDDDGNYVGSLPGYGWKAGTSMAAPNVAGAAALVKSANPDYTPKQVRSALQRAAPVPDGYGKEYYGAGYLNVVDAL